MNIVLFEPRIPQNTGTIGRLCVTAGANLHLIHPLGFAISDKAIKRAGLDYWPRLKLFEWENIEHFWNNHPLDSNHFIISTKGKKPYFYEKLDNNCFIYFGREDMGMSAFIMEKCKEKLLRIPMQENERSINLANAVSIVAYEVVRQNYIKI